MARFKVTVGAFITAFSQRTFTVSADDEDEAFAKAEERFVRAWELSPRCNDIGAVEHDSIEEI